MKIERKTLNDVPGVPCPFCGEGTLAFDSLNSFVHAVQHGTGPRCRKCGAGVGMSTSGARACVDRLTVLNDEAERILAMADQTV